LPSVCEPASIAEAAEVFRRAAAEGARVSIEREGGDVVVSTRALNRLLEHSPGDLTCIAEAGLRLSELDAELAPHGQMLMLDPPGDPTLGACLAANLSGPRRHRYGAPRDLVLGATLVLADGTVAHSGGRVVKNVAGYDLAKLFSGSRGSFGLVAAVALRLHPRPAARATLAVPVDEPEEAHRLAQLVLRSQLAPSAVDLLWPGRLALLFEGGTRSVEAQLGAARQLVGARHVPGTEENVWQEIAEVQQAAAGRVSFEPGRLAAFLAETPRALVRVAAGSAYVPDAVAHEPSFLVERIRAQLDPRGVLVA
jgi:glycolate oxidase FAD binding subunit